MPEPEVIIENAETGGSLILRRALFGGLFACIGAATGWLFWLALQVGVRVLIAPLIGVVIELVRWGYGRYKKLPLAERTASDEADASPDAAAEDQGFKIGWSTIGAASVLFLALVLGVAADLIKDNLLQFVQSLAVFFPVGAVFAVAFNKDSFQSENIMERLPYGVAAGIGATMASILIFLAMGGTAAIANIYSGWWVLVGICFAAVHVDRTDSHRGFILVPLAGIFILLFAILILVAFNLDRLAVGPFKVIPASVNSLLTGPDLPATSWTKPPEQDNGRNVKEDGMPPEPEKTKPGETNWAFSMLDCTGLPPLNITRTEITAGCDDSNSINSMLAPRDWAKGIRQTCLVPACDNLDTMCPPMGGSSTSELLYPGQGKPFGESDPAKRNEEREACSQRRGKCDAGVERWLNWVKEHPYADHYLIQQAMAAELGKEPHTFRRRMLCKQLRLGLGSGLARSLLAVIFFSIFWGWGKSVEVKTRPDNYERSRVRRIDLIVLAGVGLFIAAVIALSQWNASA